MLDGDVQAFLEHVKDAARVVCRSKRLEEGPELIDENQCGTVQFKVINDLNRMHGFWRSVRQSMGDLEDEVNILREQLQRDRRTVDAYIQEHGLRRDVQDTLRAQRRSQELAETTLTSSRAIYRDKNKRRIAQNQKEWRGIRRDVARLLRDLDGVADGRRTARFRTVALVRWPDGREAVAAGTVEGRIATGPSGDGGFGYDPVFVPLEGDGRTFAEMGNEKHAISHRGRAFRDLARRLSSG